STAGGGLYVNSVTGTGVAVNQTSPTLVTPILGVASSTSLTVSGNLHLTGLGSQNCLGTAANGLVQAGSCGGGTNYWTTATNSIWNNGGAGYIVGINSTTPAAANLVVQGSSTAPTLDIFRVASSSN